MNKIILAMIISFHFFTGMYGQEDITELYLEDTSKYREITIFNTFDNNDFNINYTKYFGSTPARVLILVDSLSDGCYCLYDLSEKESKKKNKEPFIAAKGCYKNKLKQGKFEFTNGINKFSVGSIYYEMHFVNDTINGNLIEMSNGRIKYFMEYNMGCKNGFSYYYHKGTTYLLYYKDGELISKSKFDFAFP